MNNKVQEIKSRAETVVKAQDMETLIESFEMTNQKSGEVIPVVRGWIMDELEARDPKVAGEGAAQYTFEVTPGQQLALF